MLRNLQLEDSEHFCLQKNRPYSLQNKNKLSYVFYLQISAICYKFPVLGFSEK